MMCSEQNHARELSLCHWKFCLRVVLESVPNRRKQAVGFFKCFWDVLRDSLSKLVYQVNRVGLILSGPFSIIQIGNPRPVDLSITYVDSIGVECDVPSANQNDPWDYGPCSVSSRIMLEKRVPVSENFTGELL